MGRVTVWKPPSLSEPGASSALTKLAALLDSREDTSQRSNSRPALGIGAGRNQRSGRDGITFALLHLTCMRLLVGCVPRHLAATGLTLYGTVGIGAPATLLTLVSAPLYARFGAHGFWVMAALCAAALPLARTLREPFGKPT